MITHAAQAISNPASSSKMDRMPPFALIKLTMSELSFPLGQSRVFFHFRGSPRPSFCPENYGLKCLLSGKCQGIARAPPSAVSWYVTSIPTLMPSASYSSRLLADELMAWIDAMICSHPYGSKNAPNQEANGLSFSYFCNKLMKYPIWGTQLFYIVLTIPRSAASGRPAIPSGRSAGWSDFAKSHCWGW